MASPGLSFDSFTDIEKGAIIGLLLMKRSAIVFKSSNLYNDDIQDADNSHVEIRADSGSPNGRVSHIKFKASSCGPQNEMNVAFSDMNISLHEDVEKRDKPIYTNHENACGKELDFMHNQNKDYNKNSESLKDGMTSRRESQTHYKEKDKINVNSGEKINSAVGDAPIPNHISYYNQAGVSTYGGQIETTNPSSRASHVKEGNSRKKKKSPNMHHYYRHTKNFQLIDHKSKNSRMKGDENLMDNMTETGKLGYELEKDAFHLDYNHLQKPVLQVVSSVDTKQISSPKSRSKRNGGNDKSEGQPSGKYKRTTDYIGVTDYRRTKKWQAFIWITNGYQRSLGYHYIPEAAARASDKAHLVLRSPLRRKLNYPEEDYDMKRIEEWRLMSEGEFVQMLCNQSTNYSEACIDGLNEEAARQLLEMINKEKQARL